MDKLQNIGSEYFRRLPNCQSNAYNIYQPESDATTNEI